MPPEDTIKYKYDMNGIESFDSTFWIYGDWQFLGPESNLKEDAARIVSLSEILDVDPSLNEILNLPFGKEIKRDNIGSEWISL